MSKNPAPDEYRRVIQYCYAIAITLVISACVLIGSLVLRYHADARARQHSEFYHIHTIGLSAEISSQLYRLKFYVQHQIDEDTWSLGANPFALDRETAIRIGAISAALDEIVQLHKDDGDILTVGSLKRAQSRFTRLEKSLQHGSPSQTFDSIKAFEIAVNQLNQLHTQTLQSEMADMTRISARRTRLFIGAVGLVLFATGILVFRLFHLIQFQLQKHTAAEKAFLEQERMLQQSQKMEALGILVGGVAHDFNNLLTVILGNAEMLQGEMAAKTADSTSVDEIHTAGERAMELTRQLLAFSRHEMKQRELLDLNLSIREIQTLLRRLIREDITFDSKLHPGVGMVRIDRVQLEQILMNLASNASHAMPDGGIFSLQTQVVEIKPAEAENLGLKPGTFVLIRVEDTGCGMPPEVSAKVFDPFFTTKEPGEGTGLGLSTVHGIVAGSGGTIRVESDPGRGTCFKLYLPQEKELIETEQEDQVQEESLAGTESILLVEDDEQVRLMTQKILEKNGYRVHGIGNGVEALCLFKENPEAFHLILSDVILPGLRGPELISHVQEIRPDIPVVFISGYSDTDLLERIKLTQAPLLPKPFKPGELLRVVRRQADQAPN